MEPHAALYVLGDPEAEEREYRSSPAEIRLNFVEGKIVRRFGAKQLNKRTDLEGMLLYVVGAKTTFPDPGLLGVVTVVEHHPDIKEIAVRVESPTNQLKVDPCNSKELFALVNAIRGGQNQGTAFPIKDAEHLKQLRELCARWPSRG